MIYKMEVSYNSKLKNHNKGKLKKKAFFKKMRSLLLIEIYFKYYSALFLLNFVLYKNSILRIIFFLYRNYSRFRLIKLLLTK